MISEFPLGYAPLARNFPERNRIIAGCAWACVVVEAVTRLLPGVMGNERSAEAESFGAGGPELLEEPQYTRPASFRGWEVPEVLRSGDHGRVARWRRAQALHRTRQVRPDLLDARGGLSVEEARLLEEIDPVAYP